MGIHPHLGMSDRIGSPMDRDEAIVTQWKAVLQQMPAGVVLIRASDGRVIFGNSAAEGIWGGLIPGGNTDRGIEAWRGFAMDGRPYAADDWPPSRALRTGESVSAEEIEVVRVDGSRGVLSMGSSPIRNREGSIVAAVVTFTDITQAKRREVGRRFLTEASAVLSSSLEYTQTLGNVARLAVPTLADWCAVDVVRDGELRRVAVEHVDEEKAAIAARLAERYPPRLDSQNGVARVLRTGRPALIPTVTEETLRSVAVDSEHLAALRGLDLKSVMLVPLVARGRVLGGITLAASESGRAFDAEDLGLAEELALLAALAIDNARLYNESEAANQAKLDFLSVVSHELRTPLTAVIGYAELLALGIPEPLTAAQAEHMERIDIAAHHLLHLIDQILTVANLEAGTVAIVPRRFGLGEVLQRAEAIARPLARERGLELVFEPLEQDVAVNSDPDRLLQVFINVLSNAVKFTESGAIHVVAAREGDFARVSVRDTGIGIDAADIQQIFDAFRQVEAPVTRRAGGTGLGLNITRRLLDLLGGEIEVESTPGRGSTFTVRVPIAS